MFLDIYKKKKEKSTTHGIGIAYNYPFKILYSFYIQLISILISKKVISMKKVSRKRCHYGGIFVLFEYFMLR